MKRNRIVILFTFILTFLFSIDIVLAEEYPFEGVIFADSLGVHNAPNVFTSSQVTELAYGTKVKVVGLENSTYKIEYDGETGYIAKSYVININASTLNTNKEGIETYENYCNALKLSGFPENYCPYLYYLHSKYPAWEFKAEATGVSLVDAADKEKWQSALQTNNSNYYLNGNQLEASYYYIIPEVVKMFLDPQNALYENLIFQFLDLEASKEQANDVAIDNVATGHLANFKPTYKEAGRVNGINPLHLLARSKQEGASKADYGAVSGLYTTNLTGRTDITTNITFEGKTLDGFYNFYNIGAYYDSKYNLGSIGRGLAYAAGYFGQTTYGRPWDTPEKAIMGGAEFLKEQYVSRGQNTLYYEKFNVSPNKYYNLYAHQYMTNIYAPIKEGQTLYSAYKKADMLNTNFSFLIPVYTDSGVSEIGSDASSKSYNNYLSSIKVNDVVLPDFNRETLEYYYTITTGEEKAIISVDKEDNDAAVSGIGELSFIDNKINTTITVIAPSGSKRSINLTITRNIPEDGHNIEAPVIKVDDVANNLGLKLNDNTFYGISMGYSTNDLLSTISNNGAQAEVKNQGGTVKSDGNLVTGDTVTIKGTNEEKAYSVVIRGDINGDDKINIVDLLLVQKHILGKGNLETYKFYAGDTNYDSKINIVDLLLIQKHILGKGNL